MPFSWPGLLLWKISFQSVGAVYAKQPSFVAPGSYQLPVQSSHSLLRPYVMKFSAQESQTKPLLSKHDPTPSFSTDTASDVCALFRQALGIETKCSCFRKKKKKTQVGKRCSSTTAVAVNLAPEQPQSNRYAVQDSNCLIHDKNAKQTRAQIASPTFLRSAANTLPTCIICAKCNSAAFTAGFV